jgi:nitroreductase
MPSKFNYAEAFSRNIGWVSETEQALLRTKRIAIAGMGGVGGAHLLTLTRLGVGQFHLADLDCFELANFNRQAGALISTLQEPKVDVLARQARDINPELNLRLFNQGVSEKNIDDFLDDVDLFVDGLDFFVPQVRSLVFGRCYERGIPAITAGPIGMGTPYLIFMPDAMSFEDYFRLAGLPVERQYVHFLMGLTPKGWHRQYLIEPGRFNLAERYGPSTGMACQICAGVVGIEALKILLHRQPIYAAPWFHIFDVYQERYTRGRLRWGNAGPLQRLKCELGYRHVAQQLSNRSATDTNPKSPSEQPTAFSNSPSLEAIFTLARWAPSGDNTQPWRFEYKSDQHVVVHGHDTRTTVVYDLQGRASQLALGGLLETITLAASGQGLQVEIQRRETVPDTTPTFDVYFSPRSGAPDPLEPFIRARCTQRKPFSQRPLRQELYRRLEDSVAPDYQIFWLNTPEMRWAMAKLLFQNAQLRLTLPEAYAVHANVIEWAAQFSEDKIPDQALGLDKMTARLMRWALKSWKRVQVLNNYFAGTWLPRLQMDVLPAIYCATHAVIIARQQPQTLDDYITAGRMMQRFWLTATQLGLQFQPEQTPLIFASYVYDQVQFSQQPWALPAAQQITRQFESLIGSDNVKRSVYMARLGFAPVPSSRSIRKPLGALTIPCPE